MHTKYLTEIRQTILKLLDCAPQSQEWEDQLEHLCHAILTIRRFCRSNFPILEDLYEEIRENLLENLRIKAEEEDFPQSVIKSFNLASEQWMVDKLAQNSMKKWAMKLGEESFRTTLTDDYSWMDSLALLAKGTCTDSDERRKVMQEIFFAINISGKTPRGSSTLLPHERQYVIDATQDTWEFFIRNGIDKWDPDQLPFIAYFGIKAHWRLKDILKRGRREILSDPFILGAELGNFLNKIGNMSKEENIRFFDWLEEERLLRKQMQDKHQPKYPHSNLLSILHLRLQDKTWDEVAKELNLGGDAPARAVNKFFTSNIMKFKAPLLAYFSES